MARLMEIKRTVDVENGTVLFTGWDKTGAEPKPTGHSLRFTMSKASKAQRDYAALHGFNQRIGDAGALGFDKSTGKFATMDDKFQAMKEVCDWCESGNDDWDMPRSASGPRMDSTIEVLVKALMIEKPEREEAVIRVKVKAMSIVQRKAMMASDKLKSIVAEIESANLSKVDVSELFAGLDI